MERREIGLKLFGSVRYLVLGRGITFSALRAGGGILR